MIEIGENLAVATIVIGFFTMISFIAWVRNR